MGHNYSLQLLGEPLHRFSRLPSQAPSLGVPATIWRGVLERFKTYLHPSLEDPMRHRILRAFGQGPAFQVCFASAATPADTHTSHRYGVSLSRYHQHRSTMTRPCDPPQRASLSQPPRNHCPILHHQHTPPQQPPPRQALLLRPHDTAPSASSVSFDAMGKNRLHTFPSLSLLIFVTA